MRTETEYRLGVENAKLARKIHAQRIIIRAKGLPSRSPDDEVLIMDLRRRSENLSRQNVKLMTENRTLRLYISEEKITAFSFWRAVRLWWMGRGL